MFEFMNVIKALADSNRVRILCVLKGRELCVCQIIDLLGLAPSTVSKHLSILRQTRLLDDRKEGRWTYYRWPERPDVLVRKVLKLLTDSLGDDEQIQADMISVDKIMCIQKETLCRMQTKKKN